MTEEAEAETEGREFSEPNIDFWRDVYRKTDELRVKFSILVETYLAVREMAMASAAENMVKQCISQMDIATDRIRVLKLRADRAAGRLPRPDIYTHGVMTGRSFQELPPKFGTFEEKEKE
jgi:hypothetical protein